MQGGYEVASMPLRGQRSSFATSLMPSNAIPENDLDSVSGGADEDEKNDNDNDQAAVDDIVSQATKSTVIKDQIISKLHE